MKSTYLTFGILLSLAVFLGCTNTTSQDSPKKLNVDSLGNIALNQIDSLAHMQVSENSDTTNIVITMVSSFNDSEEISCLLKDYILASTYIKYDKPIPNKLLIEIRPNEKFTYKYKCLTGFSQAIYKDSNFVHYMKFVLNNLQPNEMAYYNILKPEIKSIYTKFDENWTLLTLLLNFYLAHDELEKIKLDFMIFYESANFENEDFKFDKNILDSTLIMTGYQKNEWTYDEVNEHYLNFYDLNYLYLDDTTVLFERSKTSVSDSLKSDAMTY